MKINLLNYVVELKSDDSDTFNIFSGVKRTHQIDITKDEKSIGINLILDERDNTIQIILDKKTPNLIQQDNVAIANYIVKKFYELKSSDINYGNKGTFTSLDEYYDYDGNKVLSVQEFFNYLKSENRNNLLNTIINAS
jgi:hypothetical protein